MLTMCVRKTTDATTPGVQTHSGPSAASKRKHKSLKVLKVRSGKEDRREEGGGKDRERIGERAAVKVMDDADGHLVYHKGDTLDSRCTCGLYGLLNHVRFT